MNVKLISSLLAVSLIACPLLYIFVGPALDAAQLETLKVLGIICGCSALYCFVVGELTQNNSQMDKLWSLLPIVYVWVIAARAGMPARLVVMACLATLWGARLTFNFGRKGAYKLKFWEGEEDYRWVVLRARKEFQPHWKWMLFNFFFISFYQNVLVLLTTLPALVLANSTKPFGWMDSVAAALTLASSSMKPWPTSSSGLSRPPSGSCSRKARNWKNCPLRSTWVSTPRASGALAAIPIISPSRPSGAASTFSPWPEASAS